MTLKRQRKDEKKWRGRIQKYQQKKVVKKERKL
jgi:hypothetical protein